MIKSYRNELNENIISSQINKFDISRKYSSITKHFYHAKYNIKMLEFNNYKNILNDFRNFNDNNKINLKKKLRSESFVIESKYYIDDKKDNIHIKNINKPYFRNIYSNEYLQFENQTTKIPHYIKKYKEDEITFTKNNILPEIKWQNYDNDVSTSDEQKKGAIKKELKNIGETIKRIQNNVDFFKFNVTMYKLSQKYPKIEY